mgnify:CR=1 FL=1
MNLHKIKRGILNLFPGAWVLITVILSITFIVAVDWFGAALLQLLFGAGRKDEILVRTIEISARNADGALVSFSLNAFYIALMLISFYAIFWAFWPRRQLGSAGNEAQRPETPLLEAGDKLRLFLFLLFLAVGLGWISAGLEQLIIGEISELTGIHPRLQWFMTTLYVAALGAFYYISLRSNESWRKQIVPALIVLPAFLLVWIDFVPGTLTRASILFAVLALAWGYILFQQVRYHAIPVNFMRAVHKDPARQKHLVCFVSSNRLFMDHADALTADQLKKELDERSKDVFSRDLIKLLETSIDTWKSCDPSISSKPTITRSFATLLIDELIALHKALLPGGAESGDRTVPMSRIKSHIHSELSNRTKPLSPKNAQFACDLLAIQLVVSLIKHFVPAIHNDVRLGELICWFQQITGATCNWLMPVLSVEFHSGFLGPKSAGTAMLENATFIFSRNRDVIPGSVKSAQYFGWLMHVLFRGYYEIPETALQFTYFRSKIKSEPASFGELASILPPRSNDVTNAGIDFESYEECSEAIRDIIDNLRTCDQGNIVIDFTGGQKTSTMAAVLATTSSDVKSQYISTNGYQFYGFDLRYYDMQALLS